MKIKYTNILRKDEINFSLPEFVEAVKISTEKILSKEFIGFISILSVEFEIYSAGYKHDHAEGLNLVHLNLCAIIKAEKDFFQLNDEKKTEWRLADIVNDVWDSFTE